MYELFPFDHRVKSPPPGQKAADLSRAFSPGNLRRSRASDAPPLNSGENVQSPTLYRGYRQGRKQRTSAEPSVWASDGGLEALTGEKAARALWSLRAAL